ncbi:hypothetical protein ACJMK2_028988 [Sinanodonta woodiana]|uniref:RING-type domain-containing protein n=1 Tax=Sinanodonta woodiana TaxID=1069815 RepID=A0ABD3XAS9_SINWO
MARPEGDTESSVGATSLRCFLESVLDSPEIDSNIKHARNDWTSYISFGTISQNPHVCPIRLSKSSFDYIGQGDEIICFSCGFRNKNWKAGESPYDIHTRFSPNCKFANGNEDGNIPILDGNVYCSGSCRDTNQISDTIALSPTRENRERNEKQFEPSCTKINDKLSNTCIAKSHYSPTDTNNRPEEAANNTGKFAGQSMSNAALDKPMIRPLRNPEFSAITSGTLNAKTEDSKLEIPKSEPVKESIDIPEMYVEKPKHPDYSILTSRLESFRGWPSLAAQKPSELAAAGLYYVGVGDCVQCFYCGGGLRSWEEEDDPWQEHARWYPNCAFLKQFKGEDFVLRQMAGINLRSEDTLDIESHDVWGTCEMKSGDGACIIGIKSRVGEDAPSNSMDSPAVQSILSMGYSLEMVRQAIESLESRKGQSNMLVNDLLEVIFEIEEAQTLKQANEPKSTNKMVKKPDDINGIWYAENASNERKINHCSPDNNCLSKVKEENDSSKSNMSYTELESLLEQNQELKDQMTCKICMDREACIVFLPCCHMMACPQCAPSLRICPICRQLIKGTIKAYVS